MQQLITLPKEWYIARLNYLVEILSGLPVLKTGVHKGKEIIRIYSNLNKRSEVCRESKKWEESYRLYLYRQSLLNEIVVLKNEFTELFGTTYEKEKGKYVILKNESSKLTVDFYNQLKDDDCTFPKDKSYVFNEHVFRSRIEMIVAQVASSIHMTYKYDCGINLYTNKLYCDLIFSFPEFNRCVFLEIMGLLDNADYVKNCTKKFAEYSMAGFLYGREWFILGSDSKSMPSIDSIKQTLVNMISLLCVEYVREL